MQRQFGSIRIERVLAILLFVVLITVFIYKVLGIAGISERMLIEGRIKQFQAAIDLQFANMIMEGKQQQALELDGANPIKFYKKIFPDQALTDYKGERWNVPFEQLEAGSWIFDTQTKHLIYKLKQDDLVTNTDPLLLRLQWRVKPHIIKENSLTGSGKRSRVESIKLEPVHAFYWNN
jgi:hypothetical protein